MSIRKAKRDTLYGRSNTRDSREKMPYEGFKLVEAKEDSESKIRKYKMIWRYAVGVEPTTETTRAPKLPAALSRHEVDCEGSGFGR